MHCVNARNRKWKRERENWLIDVHLRHVQCSRLQILPFLCSFPQKIKVFSWNRENYYCRNSIYCIMWKLLYFQRTLIQAQSVPTCFTTDVSAVSFCSQIMHKTHKDSQFIIIKMPRQKSTANFMFLQLCFYAKLTYWTRTSLLLLLNYNFPEKLLSWWQRDWSFI